jgi:hypothetical protein
LCARLVFRLLFRGLCHTPASWARVTWADIHSLARFLAHKDLRMAARYQYLSLAFTAEAGGRLDAVFGLESPLEVPQLPEAVGAEAISAVN